VAREVITALSRSQENTPEVRIEPESELADRRGGADALQVVEQPVEPQRVAVDERGGGNQGADRPPGVHWVEARRRPLAEQEDSG